MNLFKEVITNLLKLLSKLRILAGIKNHSRKLQIKVGRVMRGRYNSGLYLREKPFQQYSG